MRKKYIDNMRWMIIVSVFVYHVICIFNSEGMAMNFNSAGIRGLDVIGYFFNPWFMGAMFLLSGMSTRYSLSSRSTKEYRRERNHKLLIPFVMGLIIIAPIVSTITFKAADADVYGGLDAIPVPVLKSAAAYIIKMIAGSGPLWFLIELYVISMVFLVIYRFDKDDKLWNKFSSIKPWQLIALVIPVVLMGQVGNILSNTLRNGLYFTLFILGYFVFSHDEVQSTVKKYYGLFLIIAALCFIGVLWKYFGTNWAECGTSYLNECFAWFMILGFMGFSMQKLEFENSFTKYMKSISFGIYLFHYVIMTAVSYEVCTKLALPAAVNYVAVFALSAVMTIAAVEIISRIPVLNRLFGLKKKMKKAAAV